jgi:hypothetical protein
MGTTLLSLFLDSSRCGIKSMVERDFGILKSCKNGCVVTKNTQASIKRLGCTGLIRRGTKVVMDDDKKTIRLIPTAKMTTSGKHLAKIE